MFSISSQSSTEVNYYSDGLNYFANAYGDFLDQATADHDLMSSSYAQLYASSLTDSSLTT